MEHLIDSSLLVSIILNYYLLILIQSYYLSSYLKIKLVYLCILVKLFIILNLYLVNYKYSSCIFYY
jgi:hypothetical protein